RFERELQKLTELPIRLLRLFIFELLRNREERPLQVRWRQIDSAPIGIGAARVETKRARPDHAAEDDEAVPVHVISGGLDAALSDALPDSKLGPAQTGLAAVRKTNAVRVGDVRWRTDDDADSARRKRAACLDDRHLRLRDDASSGRNDELHDGIVPIAFVRGTRLLLNIHRI